MDAWRRAGPVKAPGHNGTGCVFGPVPSRRLGRSLGIDLVPPKTCSYDCVYCQIGRTTRLSMERQAWCDPEDILRQLQPRLATTPDFITLSGAGEPTLYAGLGALLAGIKALTHIPVAVITNGSLLWQPALRAELRLADLVVPSLDAGDAETFARVNRPVPGINFEGMAQGLVDFRREYPGRYWLEILLVRGLNDSPASLGRLADWAARIAPDKIQLNTVVRPPAESGMQPVPAGQLAEMARLFSPPAEVIAEFAAAGAAGQAATPADVLALLQRHPSSATDVSAGLGLSRAAAEALLQTLVRDGRAAVTQQAGRSYYMAADGARGSA